MCTRGSKGLPLNVTRCAICVGTLGNAIGNVRAAVLVEGLKEMAKLKELILCSEYCMVGTFVK